MSRIYPSIPCETLQTPCRTVILLLGLAACAACAGSPQSSTPGVTASGSRDARREMGQVSGPGAGAAQSDFSGWEGWTQVTQSRIQSVGHAGLRADIYVEPPNAATYDKGGTMPVGFRVAKAGYDSRGTFFAVTGMVKMPPGYDPEHGDWYYVVVLRDGHTATMQGLLTPCRDCHERAKIRDYLFGVTTN
jgi:hypothetical protein